MSKKKLPKVGEIVLGEDNYHIIELYKFCGTHWMVKITDSLWEECKKWDEPFKWSYISWNEVNE